MEKKIPIKSLYLLLIISIGLIGLGVGSTYAIFTASTKIDNPISFNSNLSHNSTIINMTQIIVPADDVITTTLNVTNDSANVLNYTSWYINNNDNIKVLCENNSSQGNLAVGDTVSIIVKIINNSDEDFTVNLGISSTPDNSDVVLGNNMMQIENINVLMGLETAPSNATALFLSSQLSRNQISSVTFVDNINVPSGNTSVDVSKYTDGSILMWYGNANSTGNYDIYIGSNKEKTYVDNGVFLFSFMLNLSTINFNNLVNTSMAEDMKGMFGYCAKIEELDLTSFDTSKVTNIQAIFSKCSNLKSLNVNNWDTSKITNMQASFNDCRTLTTLDIANWNVSSVENMNYIFQTCLSLESLDLSNWDVSSVTTMRGMFLSTSQIGPMALTSIGDVSNWNTSNVTDMYAMFQLCVNLENLNLSNWKVSNVTNMQAMFYNCSSLETLNISNWDVRNVETFTGMFQYCIKLQELDISSWNTTNATNMTGMFGECRQLTKIYVSNNWSTTNVTASSDMFYNCTSLVGGAGTTYNVSNITASYARIDGGTSNPGYLTSKV